MKLVAEETAKAQFESLLDRASQGEVIVVTREGKPLAEISRARDHEAEARAVETIREIGERIHRRSAITREEIRSWIDEGRP